MLQRETSQRYVFNAPHPGAEPHDLFRDGQDLTRLAAILWNSQRLMALWSLAGVVAAIVAAALYLALRPPSFTASANLLIYDTTMQMSGPDAVVTQVLVENSLIQSEIELAKSSRVIGRAINAIGAVAVEAALPQQNEIAKFLAGLVPARTSPALTAASASEALLARLRAVVTVGRAGASQIISIGVRSGTVDGAATLANGIANALVADQTEASAVVTTSPLLRERVKALGPMARIIDDATPPRQKDGPRALVVLLAALVGGGAVGACAAAAWSIFSRRIRCRQQLSAVSSAEFLGSIPEFPSSWLAQNWATLLSSAVEDRDSLWGLTAQSPMADLAAVLGRTRGALREVSAAKLRIVGVTACSHDDGATFFAVNLARQTASEGHRTLFIDAASERPAVSRDIADEETLGLHQVLTDPELIDRAAIKVAGTNLSVLPNGVWRGDRDEGWADLAAYVSDAATKTYDWIVVDLPPLTPTAGVRCACQFVDNLIVVTRWGATSTTELSEGLDILGPGVSKHLGMIINRAPSAPTRRPPPTAEDEAKAHQKTAARVLARVGAAIGITALVTFSGPSTGAEYHLGVSDKVRVKVQEWPDLAGDYSVNPEGMLSLPLIGDIKAAGASVKEVAASIVARLAQRSPSTERPSVAAVEIVEFRPIYVVGDIEKPGQYPFRPGMTVVQAIGLAGGYHRSTDPGLLRLGRDIAMAQGEIDSLSDKRLRKLGRAARLTAEFEEKPDVTFPAELTTRTDVRFANEIMEGERSAFAQDRSEGERDARYLSTVRDLYQQEIASLQGQIEDLKREGDVIQQQLGGLKKLAGKGLALMPTQTMLARMSAQIDNEQLNMNTAIVRANEEIAQSEKLVAEHADDRRRKLIADLQDVKSEIADLGIRIATARDLKDEASVRAPREAEAQALNRDARGPVIVLRADRSEGATIAEETTILQAGDVVKVAPPKREGSIDVGALQRPASDADRLKASSTSN